jgi:heat shock protein HslJ
MTTSKMLLAALAGFLLVAAAACSPLTSNTPTAGGKDVLAGTKWRLVSFGLPGSETPTVEEVELTLEFGEKSQVGGSAGCNTFGGEYTIQGEMIDFTNITSTLMACVNEAVTQQEGEYLQALEMSGRYEVAGDRLTIWYDDEQGALNFTRG